ncbi:MAG: LLM class flavin-dependent oxidoreductase [Chloroflexi bacterium]|nr:LLM class flavin-dependent oxidoreductase [Chloroflexota bacterium]
MVLARCAADLHQLSAGRLILGVGSGDLPQEFEMLGLPTGTGRQRGEMPRKP